MSLKIVRGLQLFWGYFIAVGALVGFGMMIYDPSGVTFRMDPLLPQLREAFPFLSFMFGNFICPAFALLVVNGVTNAVSIYLIHKNNEYDALSALLCGLVLMAWIFVEFYIWGFSGLSVAYGIFAAFQITNASIFLKLKKSSADCGRITSEHFFTAKR